MKQLKEFKERSLEAFKPFAVFIDAIKRGGEVFIVALGFWEGSTENHEICEEFMADIEKRGIKWKEKY